MSAVVRATREVGAVVLGAVIGVLCGLMTLVLGIAADVVGILFYGPEDYPHEDAWYALSVSVGLLVGLGLWWLLRRRPGPQPLMASE